MMAASKSSTTTSTTSAGGLMCTLAHFLFALGFGVGRMCRSFAADCLRSPGFGVSRDGSFLLTVYAQPGFGFTCQRSFC
jgi:hypothetical protein